MVGTVGGVDEVLRAALTEALGSAPVAAAGVSGGDVAAAHRVDLDDGRRVFVKTHHAPPPGFFTTEAIGLRWLRDAGSVPVPKVLAVSDDPPLLALEWIEEGRPGTATEAELGRGLAALHRSGAPVFGREDRRTTGSRGLPNDPCDTWAEFYATQRLLPLARIARDSRRPPGRGGGRPRAGRRPRLDELGGPPEPPARLHGDLWAGNRLVDREAAAG